MKKFTQNDVIVNTIKVYPKIRFFIHSGSVSYNDTKNTGVLLNDFLNAPVIVSPVPTTVLSTEDGEFLLTEDGTFIVIE